MESHIETYSWLNEIRTWIFTRKNWDKDWSSTGGTTSTGNVARSCFMGKNNLIEWISTLIPLEFREPIKIIHLNISAILRVFNCGHLIDTGKLDSICKYTYSHLPKVFVQTQISTHISSHLSAYHIKYTINEVSIRWSLWIDISGLIISQKSRILDILKVLNSLTR